MVTRRSRMILLQVYRSGSTRSVFICQGFYRSVHAMNGSAMRYLQHARLYHHDYSDDTQMLIKSSFHVRGTYVELRPLVAHCTLKKLQMIIFASYYHYCKANIFMLILALKSYYVTLHYCRLHADILLYS